MAGEVPEVEVKVGVRGVSVKVAVGVTGVGDIVAVGGRGVDVSVSVGTPWTRVNVEVATTVGGCVGRLVDIGHPTKRTISMVIGRDIFRKNDWFNIRILSSIFYQVCYILDDFYPLFNPKMIRIVLLGKPEPWHML